MRDSVSSVRWIFPESAPIAIHLLSASMFVPSVHIFVKRLIAPIQKYPKTTKNNYKNKYYRKVMKGQWSQN